MHCANGNKNNIGKMNTNALSFQNWYARAISYVDAEVQGDVPALRKNVTTNQTDGRHRNR